MSKKSKQTPVIKLPPPPVAGWRCDLCGEIVTTKERPLVPPERGSRCHSDHLTSMEVWAACRPNLGLDALADALAKGVLGTAKIKECPSNAHQYRLEERKPAWRLACLAYRKASRGYKRSGSTRGGRRCRAIRVAATVERGEHRSRQRRGLCHEVSQRMVLARAQ